MTETSWPFDGQPMPEDSWRRLARSFVADSLLSDTGSTEAQIYADSSAMRVRRRPAPSGAVVQGFGWMDPAEMLVPIPANASSQPRIDRVVLRLNPSGNAITTVNKTGTAQAIPVAPDVTRDPVGIWEMSLGTVRVEAGAGTAGNAVQSIAPEKVLTDDRVFAGTSTLHVSTVAQLPASAPLWAEAVTADGSVYQWNGTKWSDGFHSFTTGMSQSKQITMGSAVAEYTQDGKRVHAYGQVTTAATHPGGVGRLIFTLPVPHAYGSAQGRVLGDFILWAGSAGTFAGAVATYGGAAVAGLYLPNGNAAGYIGDNIGTPGAANYLAAFDLPGGSTMSFDVHYRAA